MRTFLAALTAICVCVWPAFSWALTLDQSQIKSWQFNDLTKEPRFQLMLGGAEASLIYAGDASDKANGATVFVYVVPKPKDVTLKSDGKSWFNLVVGKKGKVVQKQETYQVSGEWRYYVESMTDSTGGNPIYNAVLAIQHGSKVVVFDYHQVKELYGNEIAQVKRLYHDLKIQNP